MIGSLPSAARAVRAADVLAAAAFALAVAALARGAAREADGVPMPGGWSLAPMWSPTCASDAFARFACFAGMWLAMTVAMMLPALAPALARIRRDAGGGTRGDGLAGVVALGYFVAWSAFGLALFPPCATLAGLVQRDGGFARAAPLAGGVVVIAAGLFQCSDWKLRRLARCRSIEVHAPRPDLAGAWRGGVRLGVDCIASCSAFTATLLVFGMMDLRAIGLVTVAIGAERNALHAAWIVRAIGAGLVGSGAGLFAASLARI